MTRDGSKYNCTYPEDVVEQPGGPCQITTVLVGPTDHANNGSVPNGLVPAFAAFVAASAPSLLDCLATSDLFPVLGKVDYVQHRMVKSPWLGQDVQGGPRWVDPESGPLRLPFPQKSEEVNGVRLCARNEERRSPSCSSSEEGDMA